MVKLLSNAALKNQWEQNELDSTWPLFVQHFAVTGLFQFKANQLATAASMLRKKTLKKPIRVIK